MLWLQRARESHYLHDFMATYVALFSPRHTLEVSGARRIIQEYAVGRTLPSTHLSSMGSAVELASTADDASADAEPLPAKAPRARIGLTTKEVPTPTETKLALTAAPHLRISRFLHRRRFQPKSYIDCNIFP